MHTCDEMSDAGVLMRGVDHSLYQKKDESVHSQNLGNGKAEMVSSGRRSGRTDRLDARDVPGDVLEVVVRSVVQDLAEPGVRVEREDGHVRVCGREGGDVRGEGGVVVDDVLLVECGVGRADVARGPLQRWDVDE